MRDRDRLYYQRRIEAEMACLLAATDRAAAAIHHDLLGRYVAKLASPGPDQSDASVPIPLQAPPLPG